MTNAKPFILIIEDDRINRKVLNILLQKRLGYSRIAEWETSENFLQKLLALPTLPDLVMMDIMIRPVDGFGMIEQIRAEPALHDLIVVAHTASVMHDQVMRMQEAGFSGLISKPIMRDHFPQLIRRLMAGETLWYVA